LPEEYLSIELKYVEDGREMILTPNGEEYIRFVEELLK